MQKLGKIKDSVKNHRKSPKSYKMHHISYINPEPVLIHSRRPGLICGPI